MGQVALGIRSLLIKAAIFFVMCALLVWALGGQLFPAPEIVDLEPVTFDGRSWFWRLYAGGDEPNAMHWELIVMDDGKPRSWLDQRWEEAAALFVRDGAMYYAGRRGDTADPWVVGRLDASGARSWTFPTRLALEQRLDLVRSGELLQDVDDNSAGESAGLDPSTGKADETDSPRSP